jgi:hypothetical protein
VDIPKLTATARAMTAKWRECFIVFSCCVGCKAAGATMRVERSNRKMTDR